MVYGFKNSGGLVMEMICYIGFYVVCFVVIYGIFEDLVCISLVLEYFFIWFDNF